MNKKELLKEEVLREEEMKHLQEIDYGMKELVHGILIGVVIGFLLAWFLFSR